MSRVKQRVGKSLFKLTLALLIAFASFSLQAIIVDNGAFTTDTESQLSWYDVPLTRGMSYNDVNAQLQGHGTLANLGLRYASIFEVVNLVDHAIGIGIGKEHFSGSSEGLSIPPHLTAPFIELQALLGITSRDFSPSRDETATIGLVSGGAICNTRCTMELITTDSAAILNIDTSLITDSTASMRIGSYLVRDASIPLPKPVPTPTTLWLFLAASIGILLATRRIKITKFRTSVRQNTIAATV